MQLDADWVYREFLRRGYRQDYAADFLDQAWKNSGSTDTRWRTEPDVYPFPPKVALCPENMLPCDSGCTGGWCDTLHGSKDAALAAAASSESKEK